MLNCVDWESWILRSLNVPTPVSFWNLNWEFHNFTKFKFYLQLPPRDNVSTSVRTIDMNTEKFSNLINQDLTKAMKIKYREKAEDDHEEQNIKNHVAHFKFLSKRQLNSRAIGKLREILYWLH